MQSSSAAPRQGAISAPQLNQQVQETSSGKVAAPAAPPAMPSESVPTPTFLSQGQPRCPPRNSTGSPQAQQTLASESNHVEDGISTDRYECSRKSRKRVDVAAAKRRACALHARAESLARLHREMCAAASAVRRWRDASRSAVSLKRRHSSAVTISEIASVGSHSNFLP